MEERLGELEKNTDGGTKVKTEAIDIINTAEQKLDTGDGQVPLSPRKTLDAGRRTLEGLDIYRLTGPVQIHQCHTPS